MTACSPGSEFREAHISVSHLPSWPIPPLPHAREATSLPPPRALPSELPSVHPGKVSWSLPCGVVVLCSQDSGGAQEPLQPRGYPHPIQHFSELSLLQGQAPTGPCFLSHPLRPTPPLEATSLPPASGQDTFSALRHHPWM